MSLSPSASAAEGLFTVGDVYRWLPQVLMTARGDETVNGVSTDSRRCRPGDLYVALAGDRFDGHDFVAEVLARGVDAIVVSRRVEVLDRWQTPVAVLHVDDTRQALGWIAAGWRRRFDLPLIAVTGSNGKTTVKEMIAAILRAHVGDAAAFATRGNLNNDVGVPQTLLTLRAQHRIGVVELGMNHRGEIGWLARQAAPTVAVVNNAQREHQEFLDGPAATAWENGEVFAALPADGVAVFPLDDLGTPIWLEQSAGRRTVTFGLGRDDVDVGAAAAASPTGFEAQFRRPGWRDRQRDAGVARDPRDAGNARDTRDDDLERIEIRLAIAGRHNVRNALAAAAACHAAGIPVTTIAAGLARFMPAPGRLERRAAADGVGLIDDTYNANPDSVRAAIELLVDEPGPRLLILGDMGEVGSQGPAFHAEVGAHARACRIDRFIAVGTACAEAARAFGPSARWFETVEAWQAALMAEGPALLGGARSVLVKGSRFMRMERIVRSLAVDGSAAAAVAPAGASFGTPVVTLVGAPVGPSAATAAAASTTGEATH